MKSYINLSFSLINPSNLTDSCRQSVRNLTYFFSVDNKRSKSGCNFRRTVSMRTPSMMKWKCRMLILSHKALPFKEMVLKNAW